MPDAVAEHSYEFAKGPHKWRLLERNRWATVIRTYPGPAAGGRAPAMLAAEVAVWLVAARGGWGRMKRLATVDVVRLLPRLVAERSSIQASTCIEEADFVAHLSAVLDSPYFGSVGTAPLLRRGLVLYWKATLWALRHVKTGARSHAL